MADHPAEVATDGNRDDVWYSADGEHYEEHSDAVTDGCTLRPQVMH